MGNVILGEPRFKKPEVVVKSDGKITDIVMFVPGTTDPINTKGLKHEANKDYWRASNENFWGKLKELKFQFHDLHIEDTFLSWSGDNNTEERTIAADRLLDLFVRVYPKYKNKEVHLHLIGHSHGGNVINQFTNLIATDKRFPKFWKIKSITYLSTPFFQKKHQLNHAKVHKECKIINVHNEYDITQRFVADFTLINLEVFLKDFHSDSFKRGMEVLASVDKKALQDNVVDFRMNEEEAIIIWREMAKVFLGVNILTNQFIKYIKSINVAKVTLDKERDEFVVLLKSLLKWTYDVHVNFSSINSGYGKSKLVSNLNLTQGVAVLNILFDIKTGVKDSYILKLLAKVFAESHGLTDSIDDTSWSPKKQAGSLTVVDRNITTNDSYHSRGKKAQFEGFATGVEGALKRNNLEELLMRLFSQFLVPATLTTFNSYLDYAEYAVTGDLDAQIKILRKNILNYQKLVTLYHANLVSDKDKKIDMAIRPGGVPYFATVSHGLSHTQFWEKVEADLRSSFSSGINTGYKKK
ncbi:MULTISPECIES: hypothetical protein [unclassified Flavobacterium]|jgi:hypothetical protein|uniref:hypothetical protein n=1 Tax=unclassified Flavobacterium TaxID=196869 RepID=UPI0005805C56|nr:MULTISPECIES: hypothetical protein [unclassified Flavobacterium]KIA97022.1 hypothetical protein OA93_15615 [Flavobacterium sp. KMS]MEA9414055.1 hypothetical protein [Flavobacterium sp. PL02]